MNGNRPSGEKTVLLLGGDSPEREVSLMSGEQIAASLRRLGVSFFALDPAREPLSEIQRRGASRAFNILHGGAGENGEVQGALRTAGIACTGSGVLASALAMDKHRSKIIFRFCGIPTPDWRIARDAEEGARAAAELGYPLFIKPSRGGSSTNSARADCAEELPGAVLAAASEGAPALIERLAGGEEYTAAILNGRVLPIIKISPPAGGYYDYRAKYISDETRFDCPCGLPADLEKRFGELALRCFRALDCGGWARADFMLDENGEPQFLEINTVPGMTSHSLVPRAAKAAGMGFDELVKTILESAR